MNWLTARGIEARRIVLHGNKDQGDVWTALGINIEAKNCRTMSLGQWVDEAKVESVNAGRPVVVCHKRVGKGDPGESFVSMPLTQFVALIGMPDSSATQSGQSCDDGSHEH